LIHLYPANKVENLLALLDKIQQVSPLPIFSKETFIVQNAGMQHWLNMSVAKSRGISLNVDYALPAQYLWKLARALVNKEDSLEQNPFSRESMCWRIFQLLATKEVINNVHFEQVTHYWLTGVEPNHACDDYSESENLKRYQLACQLADLFEQYLVFRPDWIDSWHHEEQQFELKSECSQENDQFKQMQAWQSTLWQLLTQEQSYNPVELLSQATKNLSTNKEFLPKRLCFFGLNAMPPMWLEFIHRLSEHTEVHFFHLNPCYSYWGDIITEKQAIKGLTQWTKGFDDLNISVGNPLLANLGQQGREFLALLQEYSTINIEVFEQTIADNKEDNQNSVLACIQQDILSLTDARTQPSNIVDDSIVVTSAHSALREVQGLHDWLLHQFNQDNTLTPKDVLVMCPQVEQYAPYINAVFARGWQDLDDAIPPLPCSIADRVSKDSEPLVVMFSELLTLPDSRFQISQIMSWLRIPAMQDKFSINNEEIDKFFTWAEHASIHWGLDNNHKQSLLESETVSSQFTWEYGLSRLMQGFAYSDQNEIYQNKAVLPDVEGNDAILLGKFMLIIEQLQYYAAELMQPRTPQQWHRFLNNLIDDLFEQSADSNFALLNQAIEALVEYCQHAQFNDEIGLLVVRDFLDSHFSQPDPGRQFMVGQVTFCSMLPMRSIPFAVVAVLGLNDGEYPRQRQPFSFDLMAMSASRLGDRSRRGDDRYLFLEAIISARKVLYLSYQGRSIKNNNEKQASLVLKELMEYLSLGYGWQLFGDKTDDIRQLAMQPFSEKNYLGKYAGFDKKWLALQTPEPQMTLINENPPLLIESLSLNDENTLLAAKVIKFFQHPARYFAQQQLRLSFEDYAIELVDDEPFDCDRLASYLLREEFLAIYLQESDQTKAITNIALKAKLSGQFPDLPTTEPVIEKWQQDSLNLAEFIQQDHLLKPNTYAVMLPVSITLPDNSQLTICLSASLPVSNKQLVFYRSSSPKAKDFFTLYFHQLILQVYQLQYEEEHNDNRCNLNSLLAINSTHGYYFDTKSQKSSHYFYQNIPQAQQLLQQLLQTFIKGQQQALLLNGELAEKLFKTKKFSQAAFEQYWTDSNSIQAFGDDPYIAYFWQTCPMLTDITEFIEEVYTPIINFREQVKS